MNPNVDWYFNKDTKWQKELAKLRLIVLDCLLTEELKWGVPCYTYQQKNIVLIHVFKDYCALLFHKGALLADVAGILVQQTVNVQATRQIRFTNVEEIAELEPRLKAYLYEAIEVEKAGLIVDFKKTPEFVMPDEFLSKLNESSELKIAFYALTLGRQRGYLLHFSAPKQAKTRASRVEHCVAQIIAGKGMND